MYFLSFSSRGYSLTSKAKTSSLMGYRLLLFFTSYHREKRKLFIPRLFFLAFHRGINGELNFLRWIVCIKYSGAPPPYPRPLFKEKWVKTFLDIGYSYISRLPAQMLCIWVKKKEIYENGSLFLFSYISFCIATMSHTGRLSELKTIPPYPKRFGGVGDFP